MRVEAQQAPHGQAQPPPAAVEPQVVVMPPPVVPAYLTDQGCDCSIPPEAGKEIRQTRIWAIVIIISHTVALAAFGFFNEAQWAASLCGIIAGGVLLGCYKKNIYQCSSIVFIVAAALDFVAALIWLFYGLAALFILPVIALALTIPGIICGFKAFQSWEMVSGIVVDPGVVAVHHAMAAPVVMEMPQAGAHV